MERDEIEWAIRLAFSDVRLGAGVSLRQAQVIEDYGGGLSRAEFDALPRSEVIDDWPRIPESELLRDNAAHLDSDGLRYYLPALMLWLLDHYHDEDWLTRDGVLMTTIGTIMALAPESMSEESNRWRYDSFTTEQRNTIASYLVALPRLVNLDHEDTTTVATSIDQYWAQFLPRP